PVINGPANSMIENLISFNFSVADSFMPFQIFVPFSHLTLPKILLLYTPVVTASIEQKPVSYTNTTQPT
ncbi:hypothetical protein B1169_09330, partial [Enterococcus faecium]